VNKGNQRTLLVEDMVNQAGQRRQDAVVTEEEAEAERLKLEQAQKPKQAKGDWAPPTTRTLLQE